MSFQAFLKEVQKGMPAPVYLVHSSDAFLQREALNALRGMVPEEERDFNLHIFDLLAPGEDPPAMQQMLDVANTVSFFGTRRFTVLLCSLQKVTKKNLEILGEYVANPAPGSVLVILHNGPLRKDMREKLKGLRPISLDLRETEIPGWIQQKARSKGLEISARASVFLLGLVGTDLGLLASEIEKLSLAGKKEIDSGDITEMTAGGREFSIFDLVNALRAKDAEEVFRIYNVLKGAVEDYSLLGALNWHYGRALLSGMKPSRHENPLRVFQMLHEVDRDIKSSGRAYPVEYLLVRLLRLH